MPESNAGQPPVLAYNRIYGRSVFRRQIEALGFQMKDFSAAPAAQADDILQGAQVLQISSGIHDMAPHEQAAAALFDRMPRLLMVSTIGAGHDPVDLDECTRRGIIAVNQGGGANAEAVIEHTLAMMLALGKRMVEADRLLRRTPDLDRNRFVAHSIRQRTLGIVGFGHVGRGLARLCSQAFRMEVLVASGHAQAPDLAECGARGVAFDELLVQSDYVVVCCALSDRTRGLFDARAFARMKPGAFFVTTARGGIHDEAALHAALVSGHLAGAGIDVWDVEPPPPTHPLLQLDQVIATPHIAGATLESREQAAQLAAAQIRDAMQGRRPVNLLNPSAWPQFMRRLEQAGLVLQAGSGA